LLRLLFAAACAGLARAQIQSGKLMASDAYPGQRFGDLVAAAGDWLVVGVPDDDEIAVQSGAAYTFGRTAGGFVQTQKLKALDAEYGDGFGCSVAIDGDTLVVGAYIEDPGGIIAAGSAYVFELTGGMWLQTAKLVAGPPMANATFGWSVAIEGDRILVGAQGEHAVAVSSGAAYVFERSGSGWTQTARLVASDGAYSDSFGMSAALSGDTAVLGSAADGPAGGGQGAAYVFEKTRGAWTQAAKLYASDGASSEFFSSYLTIDGDTAIIGSPGHDHGLVNSGSAYVFRRLSNGWTQTQELRSHAPALLNYFGSYVAMDGDLAIVGAKYDPNHQTARGATYAFREFAGQWTEIARMDANDELNGDIFGVPIALAGTTAFVGAPERDDLCPSAWNCNSGAVYVFDLAPDATQFGYCTSGAPCGNTQVSGGCTNALGLGATLSAAGSSSTALDDLRFEVRDMQPAKSAMLFMGGGTGQAVLGDGLRAVTGGGVGFFRYPLRTSDASGTFVEGPGLVAAGGQRFPPQGQLLSGSVWYFQCWYRDTSGPCGTGTNLTNAVQVTFVP
jgi:hypothetical protein